MRKLLCALSLLLLSALPASAQLLGVLTGGGGGGAYQATDRVGYQTWNILRTNFNTLNTWFKTGSASPEGSVTASPGAIYLRSTGLVYRKNSGSGNTGWVEMGSTAGPFLPAADGTSGAPAYSFFSESTLGFYRASAGNVALSGHLLPHTNATDNLGSGTVRWNNLYGSRVMMADSDLSAWFTNGTDPTVLTGLFSRTYTGTPGTHDVYGIFSGQTFNPGGNLLTRDYYGHYFEGTQTHTTARNGRHHYANYLAAYGDKSGNWDTFNGATCDSEYGGTGTVGLLACLNVAYWGTYDPSVGTLGAVGLAGIHIGSPFQGTTNPTFVRGIWMRDVTAGGAIAIGANDMWNLLFDTDAAGHKFGVRYDGKTLINNVLYTWPTADASGCLSSNGSGTLSFAACGGGSVTTTGSPANGNLTAFSGASTITNTNLTGDVTTSGGVATTIANDAVTYAKLQNVSAASKVLGRGDSGSGDTQELTVGSGLQISGTTLSATGASATMYAVACGRLTTESGEPVSTSDRTAQSTIYYTSDGCDLIGLYNGSWSLNAFTERSLALSGLTVDKNYDVFLYDNGGTLTLELSAAWTNDTTRADAITTQNGVRVKSGATTRRLVGTIRATGTTTTEDSAAKRFVANVNNRHRRQLAAATETTDNWSYTTAAWRQSNASTTNQLMYVVSLNDEAVNAHVRSACYSTSNVNWAAGVGVNSTTVNSARTFGTNTFNYFNNVEAEWNGLGAIGYNYLAWLEYGATGCTFYGDAGVTPMQFGIEGWVVN